MSCPSIALFELLRSVDADGTTSAQSCARQAKLAVFQELNGQDLSMDLRTL